MHSPRLSPASPPGPRLPPLPFSGALLLPFLAAGAALGFAAFCALFILAAVTYV